MYSLKKLYHQFIGQDDFGLRRGVAQKCRWDYAKEAVRQAAWKRPLCSSLNAASMV